MLSEDELWDSYFIENSNVLKNKLNINDSVELQKAEREISFKKLAYLYVNPVDGNFDIKHLKKIHKIIFESIYPFAGKFRKVEMSKNIDNFASKNDIEDRLNLLLGYMNENVANVKSPGEYAFFLASAYYEMIMIHPFREGNGRTTREFFREFVEEKSMGFYTLDLTKLNVDNMLLGVKERFIYPGLLENEFMKAIISKEKRKAFSK